MFATRALIASIAFVLIATATTCINAQNFKVREWSHISGKSATAKFKELDGDYVVLEKNNRKTVRVKLEELSQVDQRYVADLSGIKTNSATNKYKKKERQLVKAADIANFYSEEKKKNLEPEIKDWVQTRLQTLSKPVADKALLIDGEFVTPEEFASMKKMSSHLVDRWRDLIEVAENNPSFFKDAQRKITEARRIDPFSLRADFNLGLYNVFVAKNFKQAERHFTACIKRGRRYHVILDEAEERNFASALHNLALISLRSQKLTQAKALWEEAIRVDSDIEFDVSVNVSRALSFMRRNNNDRTYVRSKSGLFETYYEWNSNLPQQDSLDGWRYRSFRIPASEGKKEIIDRPGTTDMLDHACLSCSGSGKLACSNRRCSRGSVTKKRWDKTFDDQGNVIRAIGVTYQVECPTCNGANNNSCWGCEGSGKQ